jgi:hypothetical protein
MNQFDEAPSMAAQTKLSSCCRDEPLNHRSRSKRSAVTVAAANSSMFSVPSWSAGNGK